jgi:RHS repeat-associated protein
LLQRVTMKRLSSLAERLTHTKDSLRNFEIGAHERTKSGISRERKFRRHLPTRNPVLFTGKERDPESNIDDFGARFHSSTFGRWMSPDWSESPEPVPYANLSNPQTLNLYALVQDNPETFADLDGHYPVGDLTGPEGLGPCGHRQACGSELPDASPTQGDQAEAKAKADQDQNQQRQNGTQQVGNIVYNETGGLRPEEKGGSGSAPDLHNARVAVSDVIENRETARITGGLASDKVASNEQKTSQYQDSQKAASEAARSPDVTGGSQHFYLDYGQPKPSWAQGKATTTYGPFRNAAGRGDVPKGADVQIVIVHPEKQQ